MKLPPAVQQTAATLERVLLQHNVVERLWRRDAGLWHPATSTQAGIARRLGWLDDPDAGEPAPARRLAAATPRPALLVAPDDAGNVARLWLGRGGAGVALLDSHAPRAIRAAAAGYPRGLLYLADRPSPALDQLLATGTMRDGAAISAVAPAALLAQLPGGAHWLEARTGAGARFGALGAYGLAAAALAGRNLEAIAAGAGAAAEACRVSGCTNPGLRLGAALAALAQHNHDLLIVQAAPSGRHVADWLAGLLAGALSKHRRGFVPIVGADRSALPSRHAVRIVLRAPQEAIADTASPALEFGIGGDGELGALAAVWQVGVAIAAVVLGVNPFDEPDTLAFERRLQQHASGERRLSEQPAPRLRIDQLGNIPSAARWLALVSYDGSIDDDGLDTLRSAVEQRSRRPVVPVEPLRHGWATQLLHAGRPDGFMLALAPPGGADTLAGARLALDVDAWRRMGRGFAILEPS